GPHVAAAAPAPASPAPRVAAGADTAVIELAALERAGAVLGRGEARIPKAAREAGVMGRVIVIAHVDSSGAVRTAEVVRSVTLLDRAALEAARSWRFGPPAYGRRVRIPVVFTY
ncbi:MAG TPA: energy transducer TonB, partial [Candidatus Eisenbacteria bacterium]|nr:energy transducer TonB [Candidatus Eisenbacteria bacterium]